MAATSGRVLSNVCIAPREPALRVDRRGAQEVLLGHPAVDEPERRGIGGADPELLVEALEDQPRVVALDDERLDRRAAPGAVERRPHDDQVGAVAGGDVDLLAVEHVVVAVEDRGRADRGGVRARPRAR